jgi:hypothetical protein
VAHSACRAQSLSQEIERCRAKGDVLRALQVLSPLDHVNYCSVVWFRGLKRRIAADQKLAPLFARESASRAHDDGNRRGL